MKSKFNFTLALAFLLAGLATARSQSYSLDWFTIDGGGGTSTGGVYSVSGIPRCGTSPTPGR